MRQVGWKTAAHSYMKVSYFCLTLFRIQILLVAFSEWYLLPATKLWQGNVFTSGCQQSCPQRGLCPSMHHRSHDWGVSVQGGLCLGGLCPGRSLSRGLCLGSLSRGVSVWGVSVQGSLCLGVSVQGVSVWGSLSREGYLSRGSLLGRPS